MATGQVSSVGQRTVTLTCDWATANLYLMVRNRNETLALLRALLPEAARTYKVRGIALFGSVARGEQDATSDVDVLVDFEDGADLLDQVGLAIMLEERLACPVDVVPRRALRPEFADSVLAESVAP
jgi:uncharacterized protein